MAPPSLWGISGKAAAACEQLPSKARYPGLKEKGNAGDI